jgi:hypothetical protein
MTDLGATLDEFAVLHIARIKGVLPAAVITHAGQVVERLQEEGLLRVHGPTARLTGTGLKAHGRQLQQQRAVVDLDTIEAAYGRFLAVNVPVKRACAEWQQRGPDPEALFNVSAELAEYLGRVRPSLQRAAAVLPRFGGYLERLDDAAARSAGGDGAYVTSPSVDSFHTIWFECHEDYLLTLGREREDEEA